MEVDPEINELAKQITALVADTELGIALPALALSISVILQISNVSPDLFTQYFAEMGRKGSLIN